MQRCAERAIVILQAGQFQSAEIDEVIAIRNDPVFGLGREDGHVSPRARRRAASAAATPSDLPTKLQLCWALGMRAMMIAS